MAWDGKTARGTTETDGKYVFEVTATSAGEKVKASTLSFGEVTSITSTSSGVSLNVPNVGSIKLADVRQIL